MKYGDAINALESVMKKSIFTKDVQKSVLGQLAKKCISDEKYTLALLENFHGEITANFVPRFFLEI